MKRIWVTLLLGMLFSCTAYARDLSLNNIMSQVGSEMTMIFPLIYTERELSVAETNDLISRIQHIQSLFVELAPYIRKRATTYEVSYEFINNYLSDVLLAFKMNRLDYARDRLYGIGAICTSCHTQDKHLRTMFKGQTRQAFNSDYVYAEFNFLTRNYEAAERYYDKYLNDKTHKTEFQIIRPLQRLITLYTQIYNRPGEGARRIERYAKLKDHTPETRMALEGWIEGLNLLKKRGVKRVQNPDFSALESYVQLYLGDTDEPLSELYLPEREQVTRVWLRGQLYRYLNKQPKEEEIPKILFWLAVCDRSIGYNYYFSLGDMYLKDCVKNYSRYPIAKRCLAEYETFVTSAHQGPKGSFLPEKAKEELRQLKAMLPP